MWSVPKLFPPCIRVCLRSEDTLLNVQGRGAHQLCHSGLFKYNDVYFKFRLTRGYISNELVFIMGHRFTDKLTSIIVVHLFIGHIDNSLHYFRVAVTFSFKMKAV